MGFECSKETQIICLGTIFFLDLAPYCLLNALPEFMRPGTVLPASLFIATIYATFAKDKALLAIVTNKPAAYANKINTPLGIICAIGKTMFLHCKTPLTALQWS